MSDQPLRSVLTWLEGGGYSADDMVGQLQQAQSITGPVWAGWHGFGLILVDRDPATIPDDAVLSDDSGAGARTWGEAKADEDISPGIEAMREYPSVGAFAADDESIRMLCGYEDDEREPVREALEEAGFQEAADRVDEVEF